MATRVKLLGWFAVEDDGARRPPPTGKTAGLLAYLAYRQSWCGRAELIDLFWPDTQEERARSNMRSLLSRSLRRLPFTGDLEVERERLRWLVDSDAADFRAALAGKRWGRAVDLYAGELLTGIRIDDSPRFGEWLEVERQSLHADWREAILHYADELEAKSSWSAAAEILCRLRDADPLDELAVRRSMIALHRGGRSDSALSWFEAFRSRLEREVELQPEPATVALAGEIKSAADGTRDADRATDANSSGGRRNPGLPAPSTPLVGRANELAWASARLRDDGCRLLTLVGPGGVGKSRLALAVAHELLGAFRDGVFFVPAVTVLEPQQLVYAIADALSLTLGGRGEVEPQLVEAIADREMLLVMDNFEQLLPHTAPLQHLLEGTAGVKLLVTSRQRLNLQREHLFDLRGLPTPSDGAEEASEFDAIKLFNECALRSRFDFEVGAQNLPDIARICRLVDGLPLAIELAASWIRVVSASDICGEIEKGLEILQAPLQDVPKRHQSIRAVFDYSWRVLTSAEREVLEKLAVFEGAFSRDAAERVAGATLSLISGLVNKSLVNIAGDRYRLHPLIRQYLAEKLAAESERAAQLRAAHADYYTRLLGQEDRSPVQRVDSTREIEGELDNVRAAWNWAVANDRADQVGMQAPALTNFYMYRSRYLEWLDTFNAAAARFRAGPRERERELVLAFLLTHLAWCNYRLGRLDDAEAAARECAAIYDLLGVPPVEGPASDPLLALGLIAVTRGDLAAAAEHGSRAVGRATETGHLHNQAVALHVLSRAALGRQQYAQALDYSESSYEIAVQLGDRWHMSNCLIEHGLAARGLGDNDAAARFFDSSYRISVEFDDAGGMAQALGELGSLALDRQAYDEARDYFRRSLELNESALEGKVLVRSLCGLADCYAATSESVAAAGNYRRALENATRMRSLPLTLPVVEGVARLLRKSGRQERATRLLNEFEIGSGAGSTAGNGEAAPSPAKLDWPQLSAHARAALDLVAPEG